MDCWAERNVVERVRSAASRIPVVSLEVIALGVEDRVIGIRCLSIPVTEK